MSPQFRIVVAGWAQLAMQAGAVRHQVFVVEQAVPVELELDELDALAIHAMALDGDEAIGTGRLLPDGHIGRMAVLEAYRGKGVGGLLLTALVDQARLRGDREVLLAAQCHAQGFYLQHGFKPEGDTFLDAGIVHVQMRKTLE